MTEEYGFEILAKNLKELRKRQGLTQAELARELNISRSCLANYESCKRRPHTEMIRYIAEYFGMDTASLVDRIPVAYAEMPNGKDAHYAQSMTGERLDISGISPAAKIALMEFYQYLIDKARKAENE